MIGNVHSVATPRVAVLLATYNGEAFLEAQLDSLAAQEAVAVEVFVRDDGSTDGTMRILARYADRWPRLATAQGEAGSGRDSLGPAQSFLALLRTAPEGFDGYAFCDQDDVWLPEKLAGAVQALAANPGGGPALYCSRVRCVGPDLQPRGDSPINGDTRFEHLLFENIAFGNTLVMNAAARSIIGSRPPGASAIMHDWWCALVISALGMVFYDETPRILYRQHRANAIGASASRLGEIAAHVKALWRDPRRFYPIADQAEAFLRLHGDQASPRHRALAESLVASRRSLLARLGYAAFGPIIRNRPLDAVAGRILLAAGLY